MTSDRKAACADLYTRLAEVLGPDRAETLMAQLPRFDPAGVATKSDLAELRSDPRSVRICGACAGTDPHRTAAIVGVNLRVA